MDRPLHTLGEVEAEFRPILKGNSRIHAGFRYLGMGMAALGYWHFSPSDAKFTFMPLVFCLGSLTLLVKGIFLFRRSSEGLGLSEHELANLSDPSHRKSLPSITNQFARILQDFGTGAFLLWPLLNFGENIDHSWDNPPRLSVFIAGTILFFLGLLLHRLTREEGNSAKS